MSKPNNNIESILKTNMNKAEEMIKQRQSERKYEFGFKDGKIQYTNTYIGSGAILLKSAIAYVKVYLESTNFKGLEHTTVTTYGTNKKGEITPYLTDAWIITDKTLTPNDVIELFQDIVDAGRKIYKEMNQKTK